MVEIRGERDEQIVQVFASQQTVIAQAQTGAMGGVQ